MKIAKLFLKYTATVLLFMLIGRGNASAQVTYNSKNTATVTAVAPGNVQVTDISNSGTTIVRLDGDETPVIFPMIGLAKTVGTPVIQSNGTYNITYTLRVRNYSGIALKTIQITDDLAATFPAPATFTMVGVVTKLGSSTTNGSGAIAVNTAFNGTTDKNLLLPATSSLVGMPTPASGTAYYASISFTINVNVNGNYATYNNTATTTAITDTPDAVNVTDVSHNNTSPNNGDNTKTPLFYNTPTPVNLQTSDIRVIKTVDNSSPKEGDNVIFQIKVRNLGAGDAAPVVVSDLLTSGFQYVSDDGAGAYVPATGTWSVGILTVGAANEKTLNITAKVVANRPAGDYVNTASSNHPQDPVAPNNSSTITLTPVPAADLKITNTDGKTLYVPGTSNTYTMVVTNDGPSHVTGATVTNTLPAGVTGTWTAVYTGGATGTANGTNSISELVNMPSGSTITYTYVVNVPSGTTGNFVNTATVAVPAGVTDPTPANNTATDTDTQNSTADLKITNTDGKTQYIPGTTNTYTMVVTNDGPSNVTAATVANTLPAGVTGTWTAVYTGGATGVASGTNSINQPVNMPSGSTITYTYVVSVPSSYTGSFVNTATVAVPAGVTDPTPANNTATDTDTQNSTADLKITNTDGKTQYIPGTTNTYTMVVTNDGPSDVTGATVANTLPAGVTGTWTVVYTGGGTGNANGTNSISETVNLPSGATATYTFVVSVPSNYTGSFVNTGTVTAPAGITDPTPANNTATDTDTQNSTADLQITNTDGKTQYIPGTSNTYTMVVTNAGPSDVTGATVANTLPAGVTGTWTAVYAGGASGTANGTNSIAETVNMPSGSTITYTYVVSVPSSYTGSFVNTGTVTAPAGVTDPTPANNTATDTDTQNSTADLKITNTDGKTNYTPGTSNTYTMVVTNDGPSNVTGATVTNTLPAGVTGTWTAVYTGGATGTANGTNSISESVNMPSGSTITYTYVVDVPSGTTGSFVNTATVAVPAGVTDPTPANNTATDTDTQNSIADLKITNTDGKTLYVPGTSNTYTIVVTNDGPSNVTAATVANTLPAGVTGTWTAVYAGGATGAANGANSINQSVNMPSGSTITYTYVVNVPSSYTGNFVNTATVTAPAGVTDPTPANNTATDTDTQNSIADLKITNTDGKTQYIPGTTNTYTMVVTNDGPSDVIGATVANTLPAGVTGTWTVVYTGGGTGNANGSNSIAETVNLPSGATATYTFVVSVPSSYTGNFVNTGTVTAPVGVTDPTPANNTATDTDTQNSTADLQITNTDGKTQYIPGTTNTYTMVVTNAGPSDVTGATVANTLPAGVTGTWTAVYSGGATGTANGTNSIGETVNMPSGSTITYTYVVNVPSSYTGSFVNTGTVTAPAGVTDPTPANNTATDTDTKNSIADLQITNTDGKLEYVPGTSNTYTVVVQNVGPSDAVGATVVNALPAGISTSSWTAVYSGGATGTANGTGGISETVNIPSGGQITYTVVMTIPSGRTGNMVSTATVATPAGVTDPTPANNTATDTDTQNSIADLKITNTDGKTQYIPGTTNTYTMVVTNDGPSDVTAATVANTLPAGVTGTWTAVYAGGATGTANGTNSINQSVNMPSGSTITYTYVVSVPSSYTGNFVNTGTVTAPAGVTDPTPANNTATDTDTQNSVADLQITNTDGKIQYIPGTTNTYTIVASNVGPSDVTGARVTNTLPAGVTGTWTAV
ncbi:DUF11 domain-containing protein, partial [Pedobacter sp. Hv1]|uniref:beta strand repeat-containing protein n=1 Tax=Pedobacter sp. Hv1 TaxID=1740090 RepID=UPI00128FA833